MPRFHFHTQDGSCSVDREGLDLPDIEAAREEAAKSLGDVLRDTPGLFLEHDNLQIIVTDDNDLTLFSFDLSTTKAPALAGRR